MKKFLFILLLFVSLFASAQMTVETFTLKATGEKINFLKYLPSGYDKTKKYPVLVSLSGDGEKAGSGIAALQGSGINKLLIQKTLSMPFIVVSPQTPYANYDQLSTGLFPGVFATEMLDTAIARYSGDPTKTYITGLSMGGPSVPNAMAAFPTRWAAGISMASWETDLPLAKNITGAIWDIKLDGDGTAGPPDYNINFISALPNKASKYTAMQGAGHWIWDQVYADSWENMTISPKYPGSAKPSNVYTWLSGFTTTGTTTTITPVVPVTPTTTTTIPTAIASFQSIPGKVEAESFDKYSNVATEACSDSGAGKDVGYIRAGSWIDYNVNVVTAGTYTLAFRVASTSAGTILVKNAIGAVLDSVPLPITGSWQAWKTVNSSIILPSGNQTLRIHAAQPGFNLNWMNFAVLNSVSITAPATVSIQNPSGAPITINGTTFTGDFKLIIK